MTERGGCRLPDDEPSRVDILELALDITVRKLYAGEISRLTPDDRETCVYGYIRGAIKQAIHQLTKESMTQ
jgi:hypothetical protein